MTGLAGRSGVCTGQLIAGAAAVVKGLYAEGGGIRQMAGCAVADRRPFGELSAVGIRVAGLAALRGGDESPAGSSREDRVTLQARHSGVSAGQWISLGMLAERERGGREPALRVALQATGMLTRELPGVGILVAGLAGPGRLAIPPRPALRIDRVAGLAGEGCMGTRQGVPLAMQGGTDLGVREPVLAVAV
jgi:hypothetical protein